MPSRSEYTDRLIERAERDPAFRQQLLDEPRAAVASELGIEIPESVSVRVIEEQPGEAILVLPPSTAPGELADEELLAAAGGRTGGSCTGSLYMGCD